MLDVVRAQSWEGLHQSGLLAELTGDAHLDVLFTLLLRADIAKVERVRVDQMLIALSCWLQTLAPTNGAGVVDFQGVAGAADKRLGATESATDARKP